VIAVTRKTCAMTSTERFTDGRLPSSPMGGLFTLESRWQRWLEVEAALARAEADVGIVPREVADTIAAVASIDRLDLARVRADMATSSHPLMPLITELARVAGEPAGGWVHWGATTQNITQTGDAMELRAAHHALLGLLADLFAALAALAERGAELPMAGRTHGQQAVPITFGFKVAGWIDEFSRHLQRLRAVEPRVFTAMLGGAVGNFASLGPAGPEVQSRLADHLGLTAVKLPSRAVGDSLAEYVCILALIAGTGARIAGEVYALSRTEIGELAEPAPEGTIGSSTMPHKRNPQLADDCLALSAEIRALVPLALEGMLRDHEVDGAHSDMTDTAVHRACLATGALLIRLVTITSDLSLHPDRMRANLELTGGLLASERVMLTLGHDVGRQRAHELVHEAAIATSTTTTFLDALSADTRITEHLTRDQLADLLRPEQGLGLSNQLAREAARTATDLAHQLSDRTDSA